jgi:hypothetical protein
MFAWREIVHDRERKDLYNRLMARDLSEYKTMATSGKPPPGRVRNTVLAGMRHSTNQMNGAAGD